MAVESRVIWTEPEQRVLIGDCREGMRALPAKSVHTCCTSPPYFSQRDYLCDGQIGLEATPEEYIRQLVDVFTECGRVLRDDAILWVNLGETMRDKCCLGIPFRFADAMVAAGWLWRQTLPWPKRNAMPDSAKDRPGSAVEYFMQFTKGPQYFYDHIAVMRKGSGMSGGASFGKQNHDTEGTKVAARKLESAAERSEVEGMRNFRNSDLFFSSMETPPFGLVSDENGLPLALDVNPKSFHGAHFAVYPEELITPLVLASTSAAGCCSECGAPLVRKFSKECVVHDKWYGSKHGDAGRHSRGTAGASFKEVIGIQTEGWEPQCNCGAGVEPCTILDPFGGSATTCVVAKKHGRRGIACELNPDYVPLMQARLAGAKVRAEKNCAAQNSFL